MQDLGNLSVIFFKNVEKISSVWFSHLARWWYSHKIIRFSENQNYRIDKSVGYIYPIPLTWYWTLTWICITSLDFLININMSIVICTEHIYILLVNNLVMLLPQLASLQNFEEKFSKVSLKRKCVLTLRQWMWIKNTNQMIIQSTVDKILEFITVFSKCSSGLLHHRNSVHFCFLKIFKI